MSGQFAKAGLFAIALLAGDVQAGAPEDVPEQAPAADRRAQIGAPILAPQASAPPPPRIASRYITPPATGQVPQATVVRLAQTRRQTAQMRPFRFPPVLMPPPPPPRTASRFLAPPAIRGAPQAPAPPPSPRIASQDITPPATRAAPQATVVRLAQAPAPDRRARGAGNAGIPAPPVPESRPAAPAREHPQTPPEKPRETASPPPPRIASRYITPPATGQAPQATVVRLVQAPEPAAAAQTEAEPALAERNAAAREAYRSASRAVGALVDRMRQAQAEVDRLRQGRDRQALRDARARARAVRAELLQARAARDAAKSERDRVLLLPPEPEPLTSSSRARVDRHFVLGYLRRLMLAGDRAELQERLRRYKTLLTSHAVAVRNVTDTQRDAGVPAQMLVGVMDYSWFATYWSIMDAGRTYSGQLTPAADSYPRKGTWSGAVAALYYHDASQANTTKISAAGTAVLTATGGGRNGTVSGRFQFAADDFPIREVTMSAPMVNGRTFSTQSSEGWSLTAAEGSAIAISNHPNASSEMTGNFFGRKHAEIAGVAHVPTVADGWSSVGYGYMHMSYGAKRPPRE